MQAARVVPVRAVALAVLLAAGLAGAEDEKWEKDGTKNGVTVWTRSVAGSEIKEIKAVGTITASTDDVWKHLIESKTFLKVMPDVVASKEVGTCGDNCAYFYQKLHHPPLKDRHYILKINWEIKTDDKGFKTYKRWWKATKEKSPSDPGAALLLEKMSGSWNLVPADDGKSTKLTYRNHVEMGGVVPIALVNPAAVSNAYVFMKNLKKAFKK